MNAEEEKNSRTNGDIYCQRKYICSYLSFDFSFGLYEDYGNFTCGGYPGVLQAMKNMIST